MSTSFNNLPVEKKAEIFYFLPLKDLVRAESVCKNWQAIINGPLYETFWKKCYQLITSDNGPKIEQPTKSLVVGRISSLLTDAKDAKDTEGTKAAWAHLYLSRLGMSTAEEVQKYVDKIQIYLIMPETFPVPFTVAGPISLHFTSLGLSSAPIATNATNEEKDKVLFVLANDHLKSDQLTEAGKVIAKMQHSEKRGEVAFELFKIYMGKKAFDKAIDSMCYMLCRFVFLADRQSVTANQALCKFVFLADRENNMGDIQTALDKFKSCDCWGACVRNLYNSLCDKGSENRERLKDLFPKAFEMPLDVNDAKYFIFNDRLDKAEERALLISPSYFKDLALQSIQEAYAARGDSIEASRIELMRKRARG